MVNQALPFKVLIVDPCKSIRGLTITVLRKLGFTEFFEANNYVTALEIFDKKSINIVITEYITGEFDLFSFMESIQKHTDEIQKTVILMTSNVDTELVAKVAQYGIRGVVVKPFTPIQMQTVLTKALKKWITIKHGRKSFLFLLFIL